MSRVLSDLQRCWEGLAGAPVSRNLGLDEEESQISFLVAKCLALSLEQPAMGDMMVPHYLHIRV